MRECLTCAWFPPRLEDLLGWRHYHSARACWWFVREIYRRHLGISLSARRLGVWTEDSLRHSGLVWDPAGEPARYDVALMQFPQHAHVGVMLDARSFLHVPTSEAGVCRGELWRVHEQVVGIYRRRP